MPLDLSGLRSRAAWTDPSPARHALLIAQPGHDLRLYGWRRRVKPMLILLTDRDDASACRVESRPFGHLPEQAVAQALLDGQHGLFVDLLEELSAGLQAAGITHLVVGAAEGSDPLQNLCRLLGEAAVLHAGKRIKLAEFAVTGAPDMGQGHDPWLVRLELSEDEFADKIKAVRAGDLLRWEFMRPVPPRLPLSVGAKDGPLPSLADALTRHLRQTAVSEASARAW